MELKIAFFLIVASVSSVLATPSYSQVAMVSLSMEKKSLEQVMDEIEHQTEFYFIFNQKQIDVNRVVDIKVENELITDILPELFKGTNVNYAVLDRKILLTTDPLENNLLAIASGTELQQNRVTGTVTDKDGSPLPGVTVLVQGTTVGALTDPNGNYSLTLPSGAKTLIFSFVGMKSQEVTIGTQTTFNVTLLDEAIGLEEVVVIGYGTQKKANLTGSVASVGAAEILKRQGTDVSNLLQGKVAGLEISQSYGKPGDEDNEIRIRGTGTFSIAGSNPLVLINGVAGNMTDLDPNNVESISILKDAASCAIYGARAANGVIIVTTKTGKAGDFIIEYHGNVQAKMATRLPDLVTNSADYMEMWNAAKLRSGMVPYFTQADIDAFRNNPNDPRYPNFDWVDNCFRTGFAQNNHLSISGGNEKSTFNLALGYMFDNGVVGISKAEKYNALFTIDTKVKKWINLGGTISFENRDITKSSRDSEPNDWRGEQILAIYCQGPNYTPTMTLPDGTVGWVTKWDKKITEWTARNPLAMDASGSFKEHPKNVASQVYLDIKLGDNFNWYSKGALNIDNYTSKLYGFLLNSYYFTNGSFAHNNFSPPGVTDKFNLNIMSTFYSTFNYHQVFNDIHNVNVLAGYNQESNHYNELAGSKTTFPTPSISELNAGDALGQSTSGTSNEWAIQSLFGRITYDIKSKYLFEVNARYDGTSRIAPEGRWGFFPSGSAGWRLSEESFMKNFTWLSNLKLRGSYGQLGNQNVGLYPWQDILSITSYPIGETLYSGLVLNRMVDKSLKWEVTTITDFGLDLSVKNGLFTLTGDWYKKVTDDILYGIPVPASVGLSSPTINYGKMSNIGWELELGHHNKIGEIQYDVSVNWSTVKNEVLKILSPSIGQRIIQEGLPFNSYYMIEWIGIFQNQAEIDEGPKHQFNPKPGDLKYRDANGDNKIDSDDRVVVDGAYPKFYYGGSLNLTWKNFNLTAFFQGVEGVKSYVQAFGNTPFMQGGAPTKEFAENAWTPTNPTNKYPAMFQQGYAPMTSTVSTYWLWDASYLRMKNLSIGYTVPSKFSNKIGLKGAYVYVSGDNILTFTKYPEGDPERVNISYNRYAAYPQVAVYTLGIKVKL